MGANKVAYFDVMHKGQFIFQLAYEYCPLFRINIEDVCKKAVEKRPTLRGKEIELCLTNNVVRNGKR